MSTQIFVNLPVKDLNKSIDFFTRLGFSFNPKFTDEKATCMIVGSDIFVMLLNEAFFKTFNKKEISDARKTTEVILSLSFESKEKVDEAVGKGMAAGATTPNQPQDFGWMYQSGFDDLDGHTVGSFLHGHRSNAQTISIIHNGVGRFLCPGETSYKYTIFTHYGYIYFNPEGNKRKRPQQDQDGRFKEAI